MALRLGDIAPDFTADTTEGQIAFHDWKDGSWAVLFSHPKDFTPVCTTELGLHGQAEGRVRQAQREGHRPVRSTRWTSHDRWASDIEETQGTAVNFPIIGDADRTVAELYDMIHPNANDTLTVRSVFVIDPANKIRLTLTYPASTGRNFDEILRVIDSLQLTDSHKVATPVNWTKGDDVIIVRRPCPTTMPKSSSPTAGTRRSPTSGSPGNPADQTGTPPTASVQHRCQPAGSIPRASMSRSTADTPPDSTSASTSATINGVTRSSVLSKRSLADEIADRVRSTSPRRLAAAADARSAVTRSR